jgi:transposase-like protein
MPKTAAIGIPFDTLANLLGLSRQTLYRWRDTARQGSTDTASPAS